MTTILRRATASFSLLAAGVAFAHPGHDAPPIHAHDLDEAIAMAAGILVIAALAIGIAAARRAKARVNRRP